MAVRPQFRAYVEDLFSGLSGAEVRSMFGGLGIFVDGVMIAVGTSDGDVALKADEITIPEFKAAGATEWLYTKKSGQTVGMGYWFVPDGVADDADEFRLWATAAIEVAFRADALKPPARRRRR